MTNLQTAVEAKIERAKEQTMSEHEAIEKETVRLLVEALKREHQLVLNWRDDSGWPKHDPDCPVCQLIRRCER